MRIKTIPMLTAGLVLLIVGACSNVTLPEGGDLRVVYDVRVHPVPEHGYLRLSEDRVPGGTYINIYANPEPGYVLQSITFRNESAAGANPSPTPASAPRFSQQINSNAAITASFIKNNNINRHTISVDPSISGGVIYPNEKMSEVTGEPIRINILPEPGFDIVEGSLKVFVVKDEIKTDEQITINLDKPEPERDMPPYTFILPSHDVIIEAEFVQLKPEDIKGRAWKYLSVGQYDIAAELYESAYQLNKSDPELILYSTLGLLGKILIDSNVRSLLGSGSLCIDPVPGTIDDWVCDNVYWDGTNKWYTEYAATIYTPEDATLPRFYFRGSDFIKPYGDSPLGSQKGVGHLVAGDERGTREKFNNYIFWILIHSYRSGFNPLVERINRYMFGKKFDAALERAASLPPDARVKLNPRLIGRFKLDALYDAVDAVHTGADDDYKEVYIGKPELEYIFGNLLAVKAAFEYISAYDWTIDLRNWLIDYVQWDWGLEEILENMFSFQVNNNKHNVRDLWKNPATAEKMLPFKNNFLTVRDSRAIGRARTYLVQAVEKANFAMDYWYTGSGSTAQFSYPSATESRKWAQQAWKQAQKALAGETKDFYFPTRLPRSISGSYWPDGSKDNYDGDPNSVLYGNKVYGVNPEVLFTPGVFSLTNLFTTQLDSSGRAPSLFKIGWYAITNENGYMVDEGYIDGYTPVTAPITASAQDKNVFGTYSAPYGRYSFEVNTKNLKALFTKGFGDLGDNNDGKELHYKVFPSTPLWPWRETYFTDKIPTSPGRKLYYFYHKTKVE